MAEKRRTCSRRQHRPGVQSPGSHQDIRRQDREGTALSNAVAVGQGSRVDGSPPGEIAPEVAVVGTPGIGHRGWEAQSRKESNSVAGEQAVEALGAVDLDARKDLIGRLGLMKIKSRVVGDVIHPVATNPATNFSGTRRCHAEEARNLAEDHAR